MRFVNSFSENLIVLDFLLDPPHPPTLISRCCRCCRVASRSVARGDVALEKRSNCMGGVPEATGICWHSRSHKICSNLLGKGNVTILSHVLSHVQYVKIVGILGIPWSKNVHGASIVAKKRRLQCLDTSEQILGAALLQFAHRSNLHREKLQWRRPFEFRGYPLWPCVFIGKIYGNEVFNIVQAIKFGDTHLFSGPFDHLVHAWQPGCGVACVVPSEPSTYANWSYQRYHAILLGKWVCHKL